MPPLCKGPIGSYKGCNRPTHSILLKNLKEHFLKPQGLQLFKNTSWSLVDAVTYPLLLIVATPLFIKLLGPEDYGIWMLVNTLIQGMQLFNMGLGDSTIRKVSMFKARNETEYANDAINGNISLGILLLFICVFSGYCFAMTPIPALFHVNSSQINLAVQLIVLGSATAGMKFIELVFLGAFKGLERFDLSAKLSLLSRGSVVLVSVLLVLNDYGLLEIFMATVLVNFINLLAQWLVLSIYNKGFWLRWISPFSRKKRPYQNYSLWYWLQSVLGMSGFLFDKLLLSYLTDLRTMAYYSVAAMIGTQIHNVLVSLGIIIFPKVSARQEHKQDLMPIYRISRFALAAVGWAAVLFLFLSSDWLMHWWLGAGTYANAKPFILLYLAYEAVLIITIVPYQMINGSDAVRYNSWYEILHRSMQILFILILGKMMGSQGIIWGLIVGTSIALPYQYFVLHKKVLKSALTEWPPLFIAAASMVLFILSDELMFQLIGITAFFLSFFLFYGIPAAKTLNARFQDHE